MGITLHQLIPALESLGADTEHINIAIEELKAMLASLDDIEVKGRRSVDTLLGCMMAVEAIIGGGGNG